MSNRVRGRQVRTVVWTAVSVMGAVLALTVLSAVKNPNGTPWLESSILGQAIITFGVVAAATVPALLGIRKDTAEVREQVQNSHNTNLRDEADKRHLELLERFDKQNDKIDRTNRKIDSMDKRYSDRYDRHEARLDKLQGGKS